MIDDSKSLYRAEFEHDACGIGFIAHLKGKPSHENISDAITMLENMEHRGGSGIDPASGDGAGIQFLIPHEFFVTEAHTIGLNLPEANQYGVGMLFTPKCAESEIMENIMKSCIEELDFKLLGTRPVPVNSDVLGETPKLNEPNISQIFVEHKDAKINEDAELLARKLYVLRKHIGSQVHKAFPKYKDDYYFASFSNRLITYKGQLTTFQVKAYFLDLQNPSLKSAVASVHSRFSTNTFPKWKLAQPFRFIAHNGEINTIKGNINWMRSSETLFESTLFSKKEINILNPVCDIEGSDSASLDNMIELLMMGGRSLPHVMMMLIPEAWQEHESMEAKRKAFYQFHSSIIEPWDGPASVCFTDGNIIGATLDRNGLRPSRYCVTDDNRVIMSSEAGALPVKQEDVVAKGRLQPGKMFVVDMAKGRIVSDEEIKDEICSRKPYQEWLAANEIPIEHLPKAIKPAYGFDENTLGQRQISFGYSSEDLRVVLKQMVETGKEPLGSMGADTPLAVLSKKSQHLSNYFKQLFAQVSNPPIDPIRERIVMSLHTSLGPTFNILSETPLHCKQISLKQPVLTNVQLDKIKQVKHTNFRAKVIDMCFDADGESGSLEQALDKLCLEADKAIVDEGHNIILLSDRQTNSNRAAIPSLLAVSTLHHHLVTQGTRVRASIVVESGDVRETHHFATLIGYGANAVNPYMAFETIHEMNQKGLLEGDISDKKAFKNYIQAVGAGLLKIFSKMGISTLQSYHGAQIFEILGLSEEVVNKSFTGSISRIGGLNYDDIAKEVLVRHNLAYHQQAKDLKLEVGGLYQWKRRGEAHLMSPTTIQLLQRSTRENNFELYKSYANEINKQNDQNITLRSLLDFNKRTPIAKEEVESAEEIMKRFSTGAMSFGSISYEAHSTLAIAMNRIGGKSNSGEGGEDEKRFFPNANGDSEKSAIKQIASGRFGVTSNYLTNAEELQIKMAQGAKPGEGGQLPGHKVDDWIGRVRHSTPGVGLISPPPHHDIYSIEDLAQLIYDLKNANRKARINVKLVSKAGVGTIAAGVAKAKADAILVSGFDGGTGASPLSSIQHTGLPWELGLAEAHQTLVMNKLRSRVVLQTDGQIRTGRDLAIAALLGAEEWGVATAALIVEGCIMMRKCHLNTCPVGIATQDKKLRKLFTGKPEDVVNFFTFMAEELRELMAELGYRTVNEMVGQAHVLKVKDNLDHWKLQRLDLSPVLYFDSKNEGTLHNSESQHHGIDNVLDRRIIADAMNSLDTGKQVDLEYEIVNTDRSVGAMVSNEISKRYGAEGLPENTINVKLNGAAGQSLGAFSTKGLVFHIDGEANDYFGKGLSGAKLIINPSKEASFRARENIIVGNVALYGATSGEVFIRGKAGERFAVRNSGATAVVEGVGDHCCEYMTGGRVVILGDTGRNFAAGMSGGIAYVYDKSMAFKAKCNMESVGLETLDDDDLNFVKSMIEKHADLTGSGSARRIINQWEMASVHFVKVMPTDYKAVLQKQKSESQDDKKLDEEVEFTI
ncbi:glutamate synthase large subunit [Aureibacter tunicatorum]|uniref:Glutamate synthase [NADPH] large chain n=1 Tax=Aureibacter tunicatorum TaxID=866807 RepID=A0AAE4BTB2_9BACT|nr:glutamate synthase large subunit [Aureibacter tunicatorum]MDR6239668.1 glutamate synthase (NADPH/NADH) large chain [Aureibacter tunicatorum]BDD04144.1 glutamate synthase [Aureibacter tunicatorum]